MTLNLKVNLRSIFILIMLILLGTIMVTPVEGSGNTSSGTITACVGTTSGPGSVKISSRVITATNLMQYSSTGTCPASESALKLNSYVRTVLVSPISGGTAVENGAALLAAMATITTATSVNPWLLKIEPGLYDLNDGLLVMQPYVDIEGSGEDMTVISSTVGSPYPPNNGTLIAAPNSHARFLTIQNVGPNNYQTAIFVPNGVQNVSFLNISASASGGSNNQGLLTSNNGAVSITNSTLMASGGSQSDGIYNAGTMSVTNSTFSASGSSNNLGFHNYGSAIVSITNSTISTSGSSSSINYAFLNDSSSSTASIIINSTLNASGGSESDGIYNGGTLSITNSTISASGGSESYGLNNAGIVSIESSALNASGGSTSYGLLNSSIATAKVGATELNGTTLPESGSGATCVASYNGSFVALISSCH